MQSSDNIRYVMRSLLNRLYNLGYIYAEIRFAPQLHTRNGLSQEEVVKAALAGLKEGLMGKSNFDANLILCCMRQADESINRETIETMIKINDSKIVAVDLAGPEAFKPSLSYNELFSLARENNLNMTIHAGEACGNDSVMGAIDIGAKRIGHGVHLSLDDASVKKVLDNNIYFEFCPTSNLQTKSLKDYQDVPLIGFRSKGIKVTINSDNMTVSNTDVIQEFKHLYQAFNLSKEDVKEYLLNAIEAAFTNDINKYRLRSYLDQRIDEFYSKIVE